MALNWQRQDYFPCLLQEGKTAQTSLEMLVDDIHTQKTKTIGAFLSHAGSEDFLWALVRFLNHSNTRCVLQIFFHVWIFLLHAVLSTAVHAA